MTMQQESDLHASIRRLAEVEGECPDDGEDVGWKAGVHTSFGYRPFQDMPHPECGGTGRIVLFPTLRVTCRGCEGCVRGEARNQRPWWLGNSCQGHGWVPELDVEKACWRVFWQLPYRVRKDIIYDGNGPRWKEAVLRAAGAWAEEQVKLER